ncbi:hypothetical protein [Natronobiforma cellulositropha]|uniref:hypothetical protein n=1 Tax=Natronobiforma cellulositropha TaxID=1679076 RepID=UPI0021D5BC29|nr:hypothetical protein [Natronobiforma cellulositropha]
MDWARVTARVPVRVVGAVVGVTVVLTAAMVGVVALISSETSAISGRLPYYALVAAVAFVATLWRLDDDSVDGMTVLIASGGIALASGVLVALAVEGAIFGVTNPEQVVATQLVVYFVAAGLVCTGLGMWSLRHWREFTGDSRPSREERSDDLLSR